MFEKKWEKRTRRPLIVRGVFCVWRPTVLLAALFCSTVAAAQEPAQSSAQQSSASAQQSSEVQPGVPENAQQNTHAPCVQPAPVLRWQDYDGKYAKTVSIFARRLDRTSVHPQSHYKPGVALCTLQTKEKFIIFVENSSDPLAFITAGFNAGLNQAEDTQHSYGQGAEGYGKRFGAEMANQASAEFFKYFLYPTMFSEDPRYYRLGQGSTEIRLRHALLHVFLARHEDASRMFNISEWLGSTSAIVLSNTYEPDNRRGVAPAAERLGINVAWDAGFDVLREFWPEIALKLRLPFRDEQPQITLAPANATRRR